MSSTITMAIYSFTHCRHRHQQPPHLHLQSFGPSWQFPTGRIEPSILRVYSGKNITYIIGRLLILCPRLVLRSLFNIWLASADPSQNQTGNLQEPHTFFSLSSSSFHFVPSSLPISPVQQQLFSTWRATKAITSTHQTQHPDFLS